MVMIARRLKSPWPPIIGEVRSMRWLPRDGDFGCVTSLSDSVIQDELRDSMQVIQTVHEIRPTKAAKCRIVAIRYLSKSLALTFNEPH